MDTDASVEEATEVLQQLGMQEYEARCFVGLTRLDVGTAKTLSEITEVPRTRVYDAVRVLEAQGLVQIQHSNPQQFRAVSLEEAVETLRDQYEDRVERLQNSLSTVELMEEGNDPPVQEVWTLSGQDAVENRTEKLLGTANSEIVLVISADSLLTEGLIETLNAVDDDIRLFIGTLTQTLKEKVQTAVPGAITFISGLDWLRGTNASENDTAIGRLLLVDRSAIMVSSIMPESKKEEAVFGNGFENGLVVIARRLMAQGLDLVRDPSA